MIYREMMYDLLAHLSFPLNEVFFWNSLTNRSPVTHPLLLPWVTAGKWIPGSLGGLGALPCVCPEPLPARVPGLVAHVAAHQGFGVSTLAQAVYLGVQSFMTTEMEKTIGCQNLSQEAIYTH